MSLRLQVNLVLASVITVFVAVLLMAEVMDTRASVHDETLAAHKVATHMIRDMAALYGHTDLPMVEATLRRLGHVRSTVITLRDESGKLLYRSPPPTYKAGRYAPGWYADLVKPAPMLSQIRFPDSTLMIRADASRAVLDGWDESVALMKIGIVVFVFGNLLVFWLVGRATRPFRIIVRGLGDMEAGDYRTRLPVMRVREANRIAQAFNRAAQAIGDNLQAREEAAAARLRAEYHQDLAAAVCERIEDERQHIAHELHDESSQSITAIRSMALALAHGRSADEAATRETATLIAATAARLHAAVHELIPRLDTPELDKISLDEVLADRVAWWRNAYPDVVMQSTVSLPPEGLGTSYALVAYRVVQEAVTNAYRHAHAKHINIDINHDAESVHIVVRDDGSGLGSGWEQPGHFGLRGMRQRVEALGGSLKVGDQSGGGVCLSAALPLT